VLKSERQQTDTAANQVQRKTLQCSAEQCEASVVGDTTGAVAVDGHNLLKVVTEAIASKAEGGGALNSAGIQFGWDTFRILCIDTPEEIRATFQIMRNIL
jgi:hypothetical protein